MKSKEGGDSYKIQKQSPEKDVGEAVFLNVGAHLKARCLLPGELVTGKSR